MNHIQLYSKKAELEINTIVKLILMGIGLIILLFIVSSLFTNNISSGFDNFFDLF